MMLQNCHHCNLLLKQHVVCTADWSTATTMHSITQHTRAEWGCHQFMHMVPTAVV
jgi:hypothetical protein